MARSSPFGLCMRVWPWCSRIVQAVRVLHYGEMEVSFMDDQDSFGSGIWPISPVMRRFPANGTARDVTKGDGAPSAWGPSAWLHVGAALFATLAIAALATFLSLFVAVTSVVALTIGVYCKLQLRWARRARALPSGTAASPLAD